MTILIYLLEATSLGLLIALCVSLRRIMALEKINHNLIAFYQEHISNQLQQIEDKIPDHYKNSNGETGILFKKDKKV